jgi:hypothetical protein
MLETQPNMYTSLLITRITEVSLELGYIENS